MNKLILTTAALVGAFTFPALAYDGVTTPTPNDIASMSAMNADAGFSFGGQASQGVVVIDLASRNETPNDVASWTAMVTKGNGPSAELQAAFAADPSLRSRIEAARPGIDLGSISAVNVAANGTIYLYTL